MYDFLIKKKKKKKQMWKFWGFFGVIEDKELNKELDYKMVRVKGMVKQIIIVYRLFRENQNNVEMYTSYIFSALYKGLDLYS